MLEFNVNFLVLDVSPWDMSGSIATHGKNAAKETWSNAKGAAHHLAISPDQDAAARDWFKEFGAWSDDEIATWSAEEVAALIIQYVSGDLNEAQSLCAGDGVADIDWPEYQRLSERGTIGGILFEHNGELWASLN